MTSTRTTPPDDRSRLRDERGTTTAEYVAVLLGVAALVTLLAVGPIGSAVGGAVEAAFGCIRVDQPSCTGEPPDGPGPTPGQPGDPDDPDDPEEPDEPPATPDPEEELAEAIEDLPEGTEIRDENGDVVWTVGDDLTGDEQVDAVLQAIVDIQAYLDSRFGRDSFDDAGGAFVVNLDDAGTIDNAFWNGTETTFGPGMATPDVIAHEFGHALDQYTSDLDGGGSLETRSLNESVADMFASNVTDDWELGEDASTGVIRDMSEPAHVDDWDSGASSGHTNAVITNHAYYQMVDGVGGLGRDTSEQILHTAMTDHLPSDADLADFRDAMLEAAEELHGTDSDAYAGVQAALDEVGLDEEWTGP